jgi:putative DNA primase/helicase
MTNPTLKSSNPIMEMALDYAKQGWPVFPCNPSTKQPYTAKGFKEATADVDRIVKWWTRQPNAMIGVPTGALVQQHVPPTKPR